MRDLGRNWEVESQRKRHEVARLKATRVLAFDIRASRQIVWDHSVMPDLRPNWRAADSVLESRADGRRGVGTTNHCMHGAKAIIENVLEWRPFDSVTITTLLPKPGAPKILMSYVFTDRPDGSVRVEVRIARPKPKDKDFVDHSFHHFAETITAEIGVLRGLIETPRNSDGDEPAFPASRRRFLEQPVPRA